MGLNLELVKMALAKVANDSLASPTAPAGTPLPPSAPPDQHDPAMLMNTIISTGHSPRIIPASTWRQAASQIIQSGNQQQQVGNVGQQVADNIKANENYWNKDDNR
jgi:hypothetical protein